MPNGEPRVVAEDVAKLLNRAGYYAPRGDVEGLPLAPLAEDAKTSTKTISKLLRGKYDTIELGLADRLCVAVGAHVGDCRTDPPES